MDYNRYFEMNKSSWDFRTKIHVKSDFYSVKKFKTGQITSLNSIELNELGEIKNKSLLHLQCHFGMDTLSLAQLGAITTGVDLSFESIQYAKFLSKETGIKSDFIRSNVYDIGQKIKTKFDIIFTSYGAIMWLPDLDKWAQLISQYLNKGGFFYIVEFHPVLMLFDDKTPKIQYNYFYSSKPLIENLQNSYTDNPSSDQVQLTECTWSHSLSDIINTLINHGLDIDFIHEFDYSPYNIFSTMKEVETGKWQIESLKGMIPMIFSIKARKC